MDQKNLAEGTEGEEDDNQSEPRRRRDGSPAMSVASAALEWDPSADVGAMGSTSSDGGGKAKDNRNQHVLEGFSEYESNYELEGGRSPPTPPNRSRPGSRSNNNKQGRRNQQQNSKGCTYSTPSSSPAPLGSLQCSPVVAESSYDNREQTSNEQEGEGVGSSRDTDGVVVSKHDTSDEDNENDGNLTEGRVTPERPVSESSTDWEYDQEKNVPTRSLSQWQTSGLTKSEIEYQTRKKNGSSTSMASSVLMLQVETKLSSPDRGSPNNPRDRKKGKKPLQSSSQKSDESSSSELDRRIQKILDRRQESSKQPQQVVDSPAVSDPSTMCGLVKDYVKLLEVESSKENIQYDVLKKHRDYHLMKVWKQISTLEKLNMQLLRFKTSHPRPSNRAINQYGRRGGEGDADYASRRAREPVEISTANKPGTLPKSSDVAEQIIAFFKNNEGLSVDKKIRMPTQKEYSSDPMMAFGNTRFQASSQQQHLQTSSRGTSLPFLTSRNTDESKSYSCCHFMPETRGEKSGREKTSRSKARRGSSRPPASETEEDEEDYDLERAAASVGLTGPVLKELIRKISVPQELLKESKKKAEKKKTAAAAKYSSSSTSSRRPTSPESIVEINENESRASSRRSKHGGGSRSKTSRSRKGKVENNSKSKCETPKPKKPPVSFFVPLFSDDMMMADVGGEDPTPQSKWVGNAKKENGLYDVKGPMKIQDCLKENYPECYQSIKERDEFILHRKTDRQMREETLLREILASDIPFNEVEDYMTTYMKFCDEEQKKRALDYLAAYDKKDDGGTYEYDFHSPSPSLFDKYFEKQRKEAQERKKEAIRNIQKNFSKNLRRYQQLGKVNVPDQLKLGRIK